MPSCPSFSLSDLDYVQNKATQKGATNAAAHILRLDYELLSNFQLTAKDASTRWTAPRRTPRWRAIRRCWCAPSSMPC